MTNKKFRDDLAKEMWKKRQERDKQLEQVENSKFSQGLKEQMKKEIMDNFNKEMDGMKSRPGYEEARRTHLAEIKAKVRVVKEKKEYEEVQKLYEDAQMFHRGKVEDYGNISETSEIPQELKDFRELWRKNILGINDEIKEKIEKALKNIPVKVEKDSDGSRLVEFKLGGKKWKILLPELNSHTDQNYARHVEDYSITKIKGDYVTLKGMNAKNGPLAKYIIEKARKKGLCMPRRIQMKTLLGELGKLIDSEDSDYEIAMLMYLTGMDGCYRLWRDDKARCVLRCLNSRRDSVWVSRDDLSANLCLIYCE